MARAPVEKIFNWPFIGAFVGGELGTLLIAVLVGWLWPRQDVATRAVAGLTALQANIDRFGPDKPIRDLRFKCEICGACRRQFASGWPGIGITNGLSKHLISGVILNFDAKKVVRKQCAPQYRKLLKLQVEGLKRLQGLTRNEAERLTGLTYLSLARLQESDADPDSLGD